VKGRGVKGEVEGEEKGEREGEGRGRETEGLLTAFYKEKGKGWEEGRKGTGEGVGRRDGKGE
jgi:hypothetical protein